MVKVTYKKSAKKGAKTYTKNLSFKATVKTPSITLNQSSVTLNVGETAPVKVTKKTPSSLVVKYTSEDPAIASVAKGTITAISAGTTNIVVTSKCGTKTITKKIKVTVETAKDGLTSVLTNQLSATDYPNTVLVSDPAIVKVTYVKGGKPVADQTLVISNDNSVAGTGSYGNYEYENTTATTNASGVATFVIKNKGANVKASSTREVAGVNYRIQLADSTAETGTNSVAGTVNFAAIYVTDVFNVNENNDTDKDDLVPGTNYTDVHRTSADGLAKTCYETNTTQGIKYTDYVISQQVSSANSDEHKVVMAGGYPVIVLPGKESDAKTTKGSQKIDYPSGEYKTYETNKQTFVLEKDPKKLSYATLNFKDVSLSKYTCLEVTAYNTEKDAKDENEDNAIDHTVYNGEMTSAGFGYQIPISKATKDGVWIVVKLLSKGQVQVGKNNGYTATTIDYVYKNPETVNKTPEPYKNGKVTWKQVDTPYTAETPITGSADINGATLPDTGAGYNSDGFDTAKYNYSVKLPVFPYTGNAVITKTDKNGNVQAYFAVETVNKENSHYNPYDVNNTNRYENVNEIVTGALAYQISADEVRETTGTISQDDTTLTMNAEKAGRMTMEGVVTIDGKEIDEADLAHVYTSVQWNPIPASTVVNSKSYVALLGQKIDVVAQLVDKNGNAVSKSGETIDFYAGNNKLAKSAPVPGLIAGGKATVVDLKSATDSQGQAKVTLKASDITTVTDVTAKLATGTKTYDVILKVAKDENVESADLYWVDADLKYEDKVGKGLTTKYAVTDTTNNVVKTKDIVGLEIEPQAGTSWLYGVYTVGTYVASDNTQKSIDIKGVDVSVSKTPESVGTFESLGEGAVKATSTKAGTMAIVNKIDGSTGTTNATVEKDGFTFAGTGAPSIDKKLELDVEWKTTGITASYIVPTGTRVTTSGALDVYLKVQDSLGNAVTGTSVKFTVDNGATITHAVADGSITVSTDANYGIAKITLNAKDGIAAGTATTVTATVDGVEDKSFDQTFKWVAPSAAVAISSAKNEETGDYVTKYNKDTKSISPVFSDDIVAESVVKEQFTVTYDVGGTTPKTLAVKNVSVSGNVVTLNLVDVPLTIEADQKITVKVDTVSNTSVTGTEVSYTLTSVQGMTYTKTVNIYAAQDKIPDET